MMKSHIILIKETTTTINIRARVEEKYKENNIQLTVMLAYYWENNLPVIKNLLELLESVLKRTINEVFPHDTLYLKYDILTDNSLENATQLEIRLKEIKADNTIFEIDGKILSLKGINKTNKTSKNELKLEKTINKEIKTEKKLSFKEFVKSQKNL